MHKAADESIGKRCNSMKKKKKYGHEDEFIRELKTLRNKLIRNKEVKKAKIIGKNIQMVRKNLSWKKRADFQEEIKKDKSRRKLQKAVQNKNSNFMTPPLRKDENGRVNLDVTLD